MAKHNYTVSGWVAVPVSIMVDADTPEEAMAEADNEWPGLTGFAGNGARGGRLIGTTHPAVSIEAPSDAPEWKSADQNH